MTPEQAEAYHAAWRLKIAAELMMSDLSKGEGSMALAQLQNVHRWHKALEGKSKSL